MPIILLVIIGMLYNCDYIEDNTDTLNFDQIEKTFTNIPVEAQMSVYWYWISDNISKEGVIKDLEAMKQVGINRVFIGNIGLPAEEQSYGKVKIFTDEWWDILHTALKKATELNIEVGLFNSPGWSQSGGPWVTPGESMRYLSTTEMSVTGPVSINTKLAKPDNEFQDVKVLAFPCDNSFKTLNSKITSVPQISNIEHIADDDPQTGVTFQSHNTVTIDFETSAPVIIRSLSVTPLPRPINMDIELLYKQSDTDSFASLKKFNLNRVNQMPSVAFSPYKPTVIAIPETKAGCFRVVLSNIRRNSGLAEISLSGEGLEELYIEKSLGRLFQRPLPSWDSYMWKDQPEITDPNAVVDIGDVIDITQFMDADGTLKWDVPVGNWKIIRSGMSPTGVVNGPASPEAVGLEVDKMSKQHIASHFDAYMGEIMRRIPPQDRKTWKVVVLDSYEVGGQNWTDEFINEFKQRYNYNPVPFIPAFNGYVVGSRDITDRFFWDLRRLIADKISYDYVGGLKEVSNKHGFTTWLENYGHWGFPGEFLQYGGQSDEIGGEFWNEDALGSIENRAASSSGHIYGKRKIYAESFTAGGAAFSRYPAKLKQRGDKYFTEGINSTLLHVYIHQPYEDKNPGMNASFSTEFNRKNTWFYDMDMFIQYLKRCNYMLQQGTYVADAAYFIGEDTPKMIGTCDPPLPKGYSFDYINAEVLMTRITVKDGYLELPDGLRYKVLVLPKQETMRPELLKKISQLVNDGAVVLGPKPSCSPSYQNYPKADTEVQQLAASLWGEVDGNNIKHAQVGKGMIASGMEMQELFNLLSVIPDFKTTGEDPVLFIHRTRKDGDIYFLSNQSQESITINPEFRINSKKPELWNPVTGTVRKLNAFTLSDGKVSVPLKLAPLESAFIVFRSSSKDSPGGNITDNYPEKEDKQEIATPWTVTFNSEMRGPQHPVIMDSLYDWTQGTNDSIKFYSGTAIYKNHIQLNNLSGDKNYYLDLGKLTSIAKVKVNGNYAGGAWTAPWCVDISDYIREGSNTIEIAVVNNWMNRLIGDSKLPEEQRQTWCAFNEFNENNELQPSGLMGPVSVYSVKYK